jgi:hypothetical protein
VAEVPPHVPAQDALVPLQGARTEPRGAPLTVTQVPTLPASLHPWHCPAQARLQQTLSTQFALVHSAPLWQAVPLALSGAQTALELQYCAVPQGRLALQPPEHLVVSAHWLLGQLVVAAAVQAPAPLQTVAVVAEPPRQLAATQVVALPGKTQAVPPLPVQLPAQGAVPPQGARPERGVPLTVTQVPTLLVSLQPWHCPAQATLQQTPSAQVALVHSVLLWQAVPFALSGRQTALELQYCPLPQEMLALQPPEHLVVSAH